MVMIIKPRVKFGVFLFLILVGIAVSANAQMTSQQAILKMTRGFNFGRCLETDLENHLITSAEMDDVKAAGFNFVRLPIQWDQHMGATAPYTIDASWLNRVQQIVDWAIARDLIILINSHHDTWIANDPSGDLERFKALWTQVSARFQNHSDHLLFEIMNEPALSVQRVNTVDDAIFPIIRNTNPKRIILFGGPGQSYNRLATCTYPANDNYLMGEIHNYDPWTFAGEGTGTWGTAAEYQAVEDIMQPAASWSASTHIPVVLGEYGAVTWGNAGSRQLYIKAMVSAAAANGFAPCVWHDYGWFSIYNPNNSASTRWSSVKNWIMDVTQAAPPNQSPTLNALANITIPANANPQAVGLTGIGSGSSSEGQTLTATAVSSNPSLIPTPVVTYTSPNATGTLTFMPVTNATGVTTITVTVNDGEAENNLVTRSFTVTVTALPDAAFKVTGISVHTTTVSLTWGSTVGKSYAIEYSHDLLAWSELMTNIPAAAGTSTSVVLNRDSTTGASKLLLQYQMGQLGPQIQDATHTVAGGNLTKGSGINLFDPLSGILYSTAPSLAVTFNAVTPDLATALGNNSFYTFTVTAGSNIADLDLDGLKFNAARGGSGVPRGFAIYVTTPTSANQLLQGSTLLTTQRTDWGPQQNVDLSSIASLQNLTAGQTVTFKIPVYSPAMTSSLDFDNISIYGNAITNGGANESANVFFRIRQ